MDASQGTELKALRLKACAEASAWIVRLHAADRGANLEAGFRAWLAAHPENARQFELVTETWDQAAVPVPGIPRFQHEDHTSTRSRWLLAAAISALLIGAAGWTARSLWWNPTYATGIGEQRVVRLSDGSRVTLNSESRIAIDYGREARRVSVDRGEAFFEVAKDASRPFRVRAGEHQVDVLGTSFVVRQDAHQFSVTLVEGKVSVSPVRTAGSLNAAAGTQRSASVTLQPGQRLQMKVKAAPRIDTPRMEAVTAWRRGEVVLDKTPLADAIVEMNRYDQRTLIIADPAIADLKLSGIYHTGDSELFARMISNIYGFQVDSRDGKIHLGSRVARK